MNELELTEAVANISGLGALMKRLPSRAEKNAAQAGVKLALRNKTTSRAQAVAALKAGELNEDAKASIASGNSRLEKGILYINKQVSAATGTLEVLNNPPTKAEGVTNFDDGKAPNDILVDAIELGAANGTGTNVAALEYYNVADLTGIPTWFQNSEIEVRCDGKTILPAIPMSVFFASGSAGSVDGRGSLKYHLNSPEWIKQGQKPNITIRSASGSALFTNNNTFLSVKFHGLVRYER